MGHAGGRLAALTEAPCAEAPRHSMNRPAAMQRDSCGHAAGSRSGAEALGRLDYRENELASVPLALGVIVEEIHVEPRLHQPSKPAHDVDVVLCEVAVDPI